METESLFGSPPSSPQRGRSPSLALPCPATEQVGATIARTGTPSELADNVANMSHSQSLHPTASQHQRSRRTNTGLPNGRQTPIPGLLRNNTSLLGAAGHIGRVNVASLNQLPRGSTYSTPILVHEGTEAPVGITYTIPSIDSAALPMPSNEAIVESLIKQRDIFPVLQSILRLMADGGSRRARSRPQFPTLENNGSGSRSKKRRRLSSVPAGAVDWDVPYPFASGEGPQSYSKTWEKERGKQLIAQLAGLIKSAVSKAAAKAHFMAVEAEAAALRKPGHSFIPIHAPIPTLPTNAPINADPSNLDSLISSLLVAASNQVDNDEAASSTCTPAPEFDQGMLDHWMSLLRNSGPNDAPPSRGPTPMESVESAMSPMESVGSRMDFVIDPTLVAMSNGAGPSNGPSHTSSAGGASPMPSASSISSMGGGPTTPVFDGTFYEPRIHNGGPDYHQLPTEPPRFTVADKGKGRAVEYNSFLPPAPPPEATQYGDFTPAPLTLPPFPPLYAPGYPLQHIPDASRFKPFATSIPSAGRVKPKRLVKVDILKRGKELRRQMEAELERANVELWEMTIEQGALGRLAKDRNLVP